MNAHPVDTYLNAATIYIKLKLYLSQSLLKLLDLAFRVFPSLFDAHLLLLLRIQSCHRLIRCSFDLLVQLAAILVMFFELLEMRDIIAILLYLIIKLLLTAVLHKRESY